MPKTVPPVSAADRKLANLFGFPDQTWLQVDLTLNTPAESDLIAADLALNRAKAKHHERNDARALRDQVMLGVLLREVA